MPAKKQRKTEEPAPKWRPLHTREPIAKRERTALMLLFVIAVGLRFALSTQISIEHWDEAVYASNRFFFPDGSYPGRYLYAPPLLPAVIEFTMLAAGPSSYAAVLPNVAVGILTVVLCWWAAREWFGRSAGLAAAALAALSDFHITFCRTALTDPLLCFWFLLSVYFAWRALARKHLGEAAIAGAAAGAAWATKYNGWLTLAVAVSGFVAWASAERFNRREWFQQLQILGVIVLVAVVCWSPVWFSLGSDKYKEVTANQAGYFVGLAGWSASFARQAANLRYFENWSSAASVALAFGLPLVFRWRPYLLCLGAVLGAVAIATGAGALLMVPTLIGPGLLLADSYRRGQTDETAQYRRLALWLVAAWSIGLFVSTPAYTPYPRLLLPWLVSAWLGTAAVCGWVDQLANGATAPKSVRLVRWASVAVWVVLALVTLHYRVTDHFAIRLTSPGARGRGGRELVLGRLAVKERAHSNLPVPGWLDRTMRGKTILEAAKRGGQSVIDASRTSPLHFVTYGEPAIFFHLSSVGLDASPVLDFSFLGPGKPPLTQPAFVMAFSSDEFQKLIGPYSKRLELIALFRETPSDLVLLDNPQDPPDVLAAEGGRPREELRLYRVKSP